MVYNCALFAYNKSTNVKRNVTMNYRARLINLIDKKNGLLLTKDVDKLGIPRQYLSILVNEGLIERVRRGVYLSPDAFDDELYRLQAKCSKAIFSHETALYLHDLTDRDPLVWSVTIPAGYNGWRLREAGIRVHSVKKELHTYGIVKSKTLYGRPILTYNKERTVCDIVRNRNKMDSAVLSEAINRYVAGKDKNIPQLMRYAKEFNVEKKVREYMEILL